MGSSLLTFLGLCWLTAAPSSWPEPPPEAGFAEEIPLPWERLNLSGREALENAFEAGEGDEPVLPPIPRRVSQPPIATAVPLSPSLNWIDRGRQEVDGHLVAEDDGEPVRLTLDPDLQKKLTRLLETYRAPYAAVVAIEPSTGRVLAMAEHSWADPTLRGLPTKAVFPAASIFKIVTAAALLEEGVRPEAVECFHGGKRGISSHLLSDSSRDRRCSTMAKALARSTNGVFAKLTLKHLSPKVLKARAEALGFNRTIAFPVPTEISLAAIPDDALGLASTGAGFGDVYLSPLHGALLAATVANRGIWKPPVLFERDLGRDDGRRVLPRDVALALTEMLALTVSTGTARKIFHERGFRLPDAAGKTGSLADKRPYRDYSWFIGFAPKDDPKVAVAAVIVNNLIWRIRAPWLAREAMRLYLARAR